MNNFQTKFEKILDLLKQFEPKSNFLNQKRLPRLSDIELIAVDLTAESFSIDSEHQLFRDLPETISSKIERRTTLLLTVCHWKYVNYLAHRELLFAKKII